MAKKKWKEARAIKLNDSVGKKTKEYKSPNCVCLFSIKIWEINSAMDCILGKQESYPRKTLLSHDATTWLWNASDRAISAWGQVYVQLPKATALRLHTWCSWSPDNSRVQLGLQPVQRMPKGLCIHKTSKEVIQFDRAIFTQSALQLVQINLLIWITT